VIYYGRLDHDFAFLKLYEEAPDVFEKFYPEIIKAKEIKTLGSLSNAVTKSSQEFKNTIIKQVKTDITKSIPLSQSKTIFADFKPSTPQVGGYIFVFDDTGQFITLDSESVTLDTPIHKVTSYKTDILYPVSNPNEAQIIIYETYSYKKPEHMYAGGYVVLRNTTVQAVYVENGKTLFKKTFMSTANLNYTRMYMQSGDGSLIPIGGFHTTPENKQYVLDDDFIPGEYAKQISEIIKKGS
jgi:hypothetical protein